MSAPTPVVPAIVLVAGEHLGSLRASFSRYEREYAIRTASSAAGALPCAVICQL